MSPRDEGTGESEDTPKEPHKSGEALESAEEKPPQLHDGHDGQVENEDLHFEASPRKEMETRSDIADDGQDHESRRVSFVVPMPPMETENKIPSILPEFRPEPQPAHHAKSTIPAKDFSQHSPIEVRKKVAKSGMPFQIITPDILNRAGAAKDQYYRQYQNSRAE
ncbi:hypothetical protein HDU97_003098 [Phlyctochytrium planicorne]|nr:hypothetical protein HDU97_003050 [Phlyctochytrium planicorne]KAJ3109670.1 hypothetical protein HDU97_003098 [Phlyctochytrium planicorne]